MNSREFQWGDLWYWLLSFLTLASLWAGTAEALSPSITAFLASRDIGNTRVLATILVLGTFTALLAAARFAGPLRASNAEIAWRTRETLPSHQLLQILGINVLLAMLAGVPLIILASHLGWTLGEIVAMAAVLVAATPASVLWATLRQRRGSSVPRWNLVRADVNVNGALMTLLTLDGSALRLASSQRDRGRRRRIRTRGSSPHARFLSITAGRTLGRIRTMLLVSAVAVAVTLAWRSPWLSLGIALIMAISMALAASGPWCDWIAEPRVRHGFSRLGPRAHASVLLGSALWPTLFLLTSLLAVGTWFALVQPHILQWQLAWWVVLGLGLPLYVIAARGVAALRSASGRESEDVVNTPELGPIPVGLIRRLTAGWMGAGVVVATSLISPALSSLLLLMNALFTRNSYTRLYSISRELS